MHNARAGGARRRPLPSIALTSSDDAVCNPARLAWIDTAKGGSIMLVVVMHVSTWFAVSVDGDGAQFWVLFSAVSAPIRMPLFFFVSGFLAVPALTKPFRASFSKTVGLYLLYLFWTAIFLSRTLSPALRGGMPAPSAIDYVASLLLPSVFWYIWALPVFYLMAWVGQRTLGRRGVLLMMPAIVLAVASSSIASATRNLFPPPLAPAMIDSVTANFIWFLSGVYFRRPWLGLIANASMRNAVAGCAAYAVIVGTCIRQGVDPKMMKLLAAPVALWSCAQIFGIARFQGVASAFLAHVGRMTLPVYIFHIFGVAVMSALFKMTRLDVRFQAADPVLGMIFIPILSIALVSASRLAGEALSRSPLKWLVMPLRLTPNNPSPLPPPCSGWRQ